MNVACEFVLAVLSILAIVCEVSAILPSPHNLTLQTLNTQYILRWQWEPQIPANQNTTFAAQFLPKFKIRRKKQDWTLVCNATLDMQCDFTDSRLHYQGIYVLRVRANCAGESSEWVQREFCPDQDANLGPPSEVQVIPGNGLLRLWIFDPLTSDNKSMRETLLPTLYFHIQYWKQSQDMVEGSHVLKTSNNDVTLLNLQRWTTYCVRVRSHFDFYNKTSHFSPVLCMETKGQIATWLVILAVCSGLAVLSFGLYRAVPLIKYTFFPSTRLPASMRPCDSGLDWSRLLAQELQVEMFCEKLEVQPMLVPPEIQPLPILPASSRHSKQDSRDSGMYSTEEGSGQQGRTSEQTSRTSGLLGGASGQMASGQTGVARALVNPAGSEQDSGIGRMVAV